MKQIPPLPLAARHRLTKARGDRSLRDVAAAVGISHTQLARIEAGTRGASPTILARLADVLGLRVKTIKTTTTSTTI